MKVKVPVKHIQNSKQCVHQGQRASPFHFYLSSSSLFKTFSTAIVNHHNAYNIINQHFHNNDDNTLDKTQQTYYDLFESEAQLLEEDLTTVKEKSSARQGESLRCKES